MKFPYSMLLDFVSTSLTAEEAGDLLTMAGFELEGIEEVEGEKVLDVKVMSNRGDGLSMLGLAREVLAKSEAAEPTALYKQASKRFPSPASQEKNPATVSIETPNCTRFACRLFENIANGPSSELIQSRLRKAGQRPISLLVDLTNYVMLELGQPLHAFDYDKLAGGRIVVQQAKKGDKLTTLDGAQHELKENQVMVCDAEKPVGVAGVMGGLETEVSEKTKRVLLESAHFVSNSVRKTRKELGLNTEASYRFERSVDPDGVVAAIERFTQLLGQPGSEIVDVYPGAKERKPLEIRVERASRLLGMRIREEQAQRHLERLGMEVVGHGDPFFVTPPSWRPDLVREEDLVEELGRVHGYEQIPERLPRGRSTLGGTRGNLQRVDVTREAAISVGYTQMISHSLRDVHPLDTQGGRVQPRVPSSPDMAYLRNSLLPSLADAAQRNGGKDLHLFEIGRVFISDKEPTACQETQNIAFLTTGELLPSARKGETVPTADFYSLKGDLDATFEHIGVTLTYQPSSADERFHPTRQAILESKDGRQLGIIGQIHPDHADQLRLPKETFLTELSLDDLLQEEPKPISLKTIAKNPAVRRDIALLIDKVVPYSKIEETIHASAAPVLEKQWLFDVFEGQGIPEGKHSLGIALQLRKVGENFTDEEANQVRARVVEALAGLGGSTR